MPALSPEARENRRQYHLHRSRRIRAELRARLHTYKASRGCADCGESRPVVLQLHHRNPKLKSFVIGTNLSAKAWSQEVEYEIAKCDVLCANCHILRHAGERDQQ